jgi:hypothetical protein
MAGLCPGHPRLSWVGAVKTWMPGTRPGMTINFMFVIPGRDLARASVRNCVSKNPKLLIQVQ